MKALNIASLTLVSSLTLPALAFGYGSSSGGGTKSCEEPVVSSESPPPDAIIKSLGQIELDLSGNADLKTLSIEVDGVRQNPVITPLRTGDQHLTIKLDPPKTAPGKVRITVRARSDETCETFKPYYLTIQP